MVVDGDTVVEPSGEAVVDVVVVDVVVDCCCVNWLNGMVHWNSPLLTCP